MNSRLRLLVNSDPQISKLLDTRVVRWGRTCCPVWDRVLFFWLFSVKKPIGSSGSRKLRTNENCRDWFRHTWTLKECLISSFHSFVFTSSKIFKNYFYTFFYVLTYEHDRPISLPIPWICICCIVSLPFLSPHKTYDWPIPTGPDNPGIHFYGVSLCFYMGTLDLESCASSRSLNPSSKLGPRRWITL